ncbi:hypothetical protein D1AOALGA4SA_9046 [Olavius algarvensis Delta 1 endosymbiont]|nr:hypothetical protein D1AOALGA4SA_9046 [Olavius algarvensis Delta 1 endosymbiont]
MKARKKAKKNFVFSYFRVFVINRFFHKMQRFHKKDSNKIATDLKVSKYIAPDMVQNSGNKAR